MHCVEQMNSAATAANGAVSLTERPLATSAADAGAEGGKVLRKPQHAFTHALELAYFDSLDAAYKLLPASDIARAAWLNVD